MDVNFQLVFFLLLIALIALAAYSIKLFKLNKRLTRRFSKVIDADKELLSVTNKKLSTEQQIVQLQSNYKEKKTYFDNLVKTVAIYDEELELAELGFYKPHYEFDASEKHKEEIASVKSKQKTLVSDKTAIVCDREWTVSGSEAEGRKMTNRGVRLTARAFNNECDSAISNTAWNNAKRMELRIEKAFDAINKLNETNAIVISRKYLRLKIEELRLTHEYKEKKQTEKEEQAEIRRQMREESKLEQESEKAYKEEEKYQKLLDKAKAEALGLSGNQLDKLEEKMKSLEKELVEAHAKSERAKSMAQLTKTGHVYIISNVGSFGDQVYKIGMTRRLDPLDRVKELGDASVPFIFDVHAMIYTEDAPGMEKSLHKAFSLKRVNLVNNRKEFFNISLDDIETEVKKSSENVEFILTSEAREFRESNAIRAQKEESKAAGDIRNEFPESL
jgi:hypothetical protein